MNYQLNKKIFFVFYSMIHLFFITPRVFGENTPTNPSSSASLNKAIPNLNLALQEDSMLGWFGQFTTAFSLDSEHAAALEFDLGPKVQRINTTYGFAINDKNRLKLTAEYLREDLDFEFYTGDTTQWIGQGAFGATYQYVLDSSWLKNLSLNSHYSSAQSKNLSTQIISYDDGSTLSDYRHIAGGKDLNGNADIGLALWRNSLLTLGPDYDRVRYDTKYDIQSGNDAQGWGGHAHLAQGLKHNVSLDLDSTLSQVYHIYGAALNWVWHSNHKAAFSTGYNSSYTQDRTAQRNFWINSLTLNIVWDPVQSSYSQETRAETADSNLTPLLSWVQTPAVYMADVLAISDERINKKPFSSISGSCPSASSVQYDTATQQYSAPGGWYQSYPTLSVNQFKIVAFDSANVAGSPNGPITCLYGLFNKPSGANNNLILQNKTYEHAVGTGENWVPGHSAFYPNVEPYPSFTCNSIPGNCTFTTVPH